MKRRAVLIICVVLLAACQQQKSDQIASIAAPPAVVSVVSAQIGTPSAVPLAQPTASSPASSVAVVEPEAQPVAVVQSPAPVRIESVVVAAEAKSAKGAITAQAVVPPVVAQPKSPAGLSEPDVIALAKKKNCFACHLIEKKVVGPSWKDVATKYRGDVAAQSKLENKIAKGGSGAWGNMAMPPQPHVSATERTLLVRFILNLK